MTCPPCSTPIAAMTASGIRSPEASESRRPDGSWQRAGMRPTPARARRSVRRRRASRQTTARTAAWWGWSALCSQQQLVGDGNHGAHEALSSASGASPIPSSLVAVRPIPTRRRRRTGTARGAGIAPGLSCRGTGATLLRDKPVRCRPGARQLSTGTRRWDPVRLARVGPVCKAGAGNGCTSIPTSFSGALSSDCSSE